MSDWSASSLDYSGSSPAGLVRWLCNGGKTIHPSQCWCYADIAQALPMLLFWETRRKDFVESFAHHVATLAPHRLLALCQVRTATQQISRCILN